MAPATDPAVILTTQITEVGTSVRELGARVFEKLDNISAEQSRLSERMARVETWGFDQKESSRRWWDKTWPDHLTALNDALKAHGARIDALEKGQGALEKISALETDLRMQQKAIARMTAFNSKIKMYVAVASCLAAAVATTLIEAGFSFLFHRPHP